MAVFDKIIIGAGFYGLYAALFSGKRGQRVLVLEHDSEPFARATFANQARVHNGYHYPRSFSTAIKSSHYFDRFVEDYGFCIHRSFDKIYAISSVHSWTNVAEFTRFCSSAGIYCLPISPEAYFVPGLCEGAFVTKEYTYDAQMLRRYLLEEVARRPGIDLRVNSPVTRIVREESQVRVFDGNGCGHTAPFLLNSTYASINQILKLLGENLFSIKYELCEIILCEADAALKNVGITVMDGPFFSIMPFGKTNLHSLTSVTFTPHQSCHGELPHFSCMNAPSTRCSSGQLGNCNHCESHPRTAWPYMSTMTRKYLKEGLEFRYADSCFAVKPILKTSEIDDSRPTVIVRHSDEPVILSVLSGKINTVYDLDEFLA